MIGTYPKKAVFVTVTLLIVTLFAATSVAQAVSYEEFALLNYMNQYREENGLGKLVLSDKLTEAAYGHSLDMSTKNYFSHDSQNGASFVDRIEATGYSTNTYLGENLAAGYWKSIDVLNGWKNSPGHNAIMLGEHFTAVGISRVYNPDSYYKWYWTADFGGVSEPSAETVQASEAGHWAYSYLKWLVDNGAMSGYPDGTFRPDNPITRAEFCSMIAKALDISSGGSKVFSDTGNHWAKGYISALADRGYIGGYSDGTFRPDHIVTRAEMVKILTEAGGLTLKSGARGFSDISDHWAQDYIMIASSNSIVNGYSNGKFRPNSICLRADTATSIYRLLN